jgi:hypothetical protein
MEDLLLLLFICLFLKNFEKMALPGMGVGGGVTEIRVWESEDLLSPLPPHPLACRRQQLYG